ncbi:hypothetical protein CRYUN_Cryun20dG0022200 [Craigia yunnanensis]
MADEEKAIHNIKDHYEQTGTYDSSARTKATTNNSLKLYSFHFLGTFKWGGISKEELDEAIMLETQLFSQIPGGASYHPSYLSHEQDSPHRSIIPGLQSVSRPLPSSLMDQCLLQQHQDEEYLISLLADKEKEMNALKKAESHSLKEESSCRRKLEGEILFDFIDVGKVVEPALAE